MSNFLIVIHKTDASESLRHWLDNLGSPASERLTRTPRPGVELTIVSKDVDGSVSGAFYFRGTAVSPERSAIAFGVDGWADLQHQVDEHSVSGEWILAKWDAKYLHIRRDVFSSVGVAYTSGPGFVAVSDSILVLDELRKQFRLPRTQHTEALLARSVLNGHATQQMSPDTYVEEIAWLPAARGLTIPIPSLKPRVDGPSVTELALRPVDYAETLRSSAAFVAGALKSLTEQPGWVAELSLSGGHDSRLILAAGVLTGALERLHVTTANRVEAHTNDYRVACDLAQRYGFALNPTRDRRDVIDYGVNPLTIWASTILGSYDRVIPVVSRRSAAREFSLTGIGAEILKGNWGWRSIEAVAAEVAKPGDVARAYGNQLSRGVRAAGARPGWSDASELQYLGYRNGIHGAGHISMHMTGVRLLQQVSMASLGHMRTDGRRVRSFRNHASVAGMGSPIVDMLAVMHPEMAALPYDTPAKRISEEHLSARSSELGGALTTSEIAVVSVHGSPDSVPAGPTSLGVEIARRRGFDVDLAPESLLQLAGDGLDAICDGRVRAVYERVAEHARWKLVTGGLPPEHAGPSTAKALSMALFL